MHQCGINNDKIQAKLLAEKTLSFDQACKIARGIETTSSDMRVMKNENLHSVGVFSKGRLGPKTYTKAVRQNRFKNYKCFACGQLGHTQRFCKQSNESEQRKSFRPKGKQSVNEIRSERSASDEDEFELDMGYLANIAGSGPVFYEVSINKKIVKMEIDTGAGHSVMHIDDKNVLFKNEAMHKFDIPLTVVTGETVNIFGYIMVEVAHPHDTNSVQKCKLVIIDGKRRFKPLAGRTFLDVLFPNWRETFKNGLVQQIVANTEEEKETEKFVSKLKANYPQVFSKDASNPIKNFKVEVHLVDGAKPMFCKPYTIAYGLRDKVETELNRLLKLNIIYPVRHSAWATPIIPVPKPNNEIRICADCKVTLNKFMKKDYYPLPRLEDLLAGLAGANFFCVVDLRDAFQQIEISENSQDLFTVNTHIGLFRYRRLFFGISNAPTFFQSVMDVALKGLNLVVCFIDDVLIGGKTFGECKANVVATFERFNEYNIRIKLEKCKFFKKKCQLFGTYYFD